MKIKSIRQVWSGRMEGHRFLELLSEPKIIAFAFTLIITQKFFPIVQFHGEFSAAFVRFCQSFPIVVLNTLDPRERKLKLFIHGNNNSGTKDDWTGKEPM